MVLTVAVQRDFLRNNTARERLAAGDIRVNFLEFTYLLINRINFNLGVYMIKNLIKLANTLDQNGLSKEANTIDNMIKKISSDEPSNVIKSEEILGAIDLEESEESTPRWLRKRDVEAKYDAAIHKIVLAIKEINSYIRVVKDDGEGSVPMITKSGILKFFSAINGERSDLLSATIGRLNIIGDDLKSALRYCIDMGDAADLEDARDSLESAKSYIDSIRDLYWKRADEMREGWSGIHPVAGQMKHFSYGLGSAKLDLETIIELIESGKSISAEKIEQAKEYNSKYLE